ncbi:hypothetical protein M446_0067 [Methylobacterium sp. 4-46]|nr:hypothetical protein M446_0067 [Methylobacterium sp. 4-46]
MSDDAARPGAAGRSARAPGALVLRAARGRSAQMRLAAALLTILALGLLMLAPATVALPVSALLLLAWPLLDRGR